MEYLVGLVLFIAVFFVARYFLSPLPRKIQSVEDAQAIIDYHINMANQQLRQHNCLLSSHLQNFDLEKREMKLFIQIGYYRQLNPSFLRSVTDSWGDAEFILRTKQKIAKGMARRKIHADIETFST